MSWDNKRKQRNKSIDERFWEKVDKSKGENACWEWMGGKNRKGYGTFTITIMPFKHRIFVAHRFAYMLFHHINNLSRDQFICHSCDNPPCCNPKHLWLGSNKSNQIDYFAKGLPNNHPVGDKNHFTKLTPEQVLEIRKLENSGLSMAKIARKFNIGSTTVFYILKRHTWKHI